jgi:peroxin-10
VQKDEYALQCFQQDAQELGAAALGGRRAERFHTEIDALTRLCYFGVTTLAGRQTLGEEYTDLLQVTTGRLQSLPGVLRRSVLVALQVVGPYLHAKAKTTGRPLHIPQQQAAAVAVVGQEVLAQQEDEPRRSWTERIRHSRVYALVARAWNTLLRRIDVVDAALSHANRVHLCLFFLFGAYVQLSKRALGIRYIYLRALSGGGMKRPSYVMLGVLLAIRLGYGVVFQSWPSWLAPLLLRQWRRVVPAAAAAAAAVAVVADEPEQQQQQQPPEAEAKSEAKGNDDDDGVDEDVTCILCLEARTETTMTECGHLFCWTCIATSCTNKPECPLCRTPCPPNRLLRLANYRKGVCGGGGGE